MGNNIFKAPESTGQQAADSLPVGRAWASKNISDSNTRKLLNSIAVAHNLTQQQIELLDDEFRIDQTTDLLREWEISVGIPDECLGTSETLAQRRAAVIDKMKKVPLVTLADLQGYIDNLFDGLGVTLFAVTDYPFGVAPAVNLKFLIVAEVLLTTEGFEYDWEVPFYGGIDTEELECVLNKVIPSNVLLIIELTG